MTTTRRNGRSVSKESAVKKEEKSIADSENGDSNDNEDKKALMPQCNGHGESPRKSKDIETMDSVSSPGAETKSDINGETKIKKEESPKAKKQKNESGHKSKALSKFDRVAAQNFDQLQKAVLDCEHELDIFRNEQEAERAARIHNVDNTPSEMKGSPQKKPTPDRPRRKRAYSCIMKEAMETKAELAKHKNCPHKNISHKLQKIRNSFNFKVEVVAEALSVYRRNVDTDDGHGAALVFQEGKKDYKREFENKNNTDDEGNSYNEKRDIIERAESLVSVWRMTLQRGDKISCPDYFDQYVCEDEKRGWVKLFKAEIIDCIDGDALHSDYGYYLKNDKKDFQNDQRETKEDGAKLVESSSMVEGKKAESSENGRHLEKDKNTENKPLEKQEKEPPRISLGDSSQHNSLKYKYEVLPNEKAIKVHYIGYPKAENRWLLLSGEVGEWHSGSGKGRSKSKGSDGLIQPMETHRLSEYALKKEYGLSDSEFERSDEETESKEGNEIDEKPLKKGVRAKSSPKKKRSRPQSPDSPPSAGRKRGRNSSKRALVLDDIEEDDKSAGIRKRKLWTESEDELLSRFIVDHMKEISDDKNGNVDWKNIDTPKNTFWEELAPVSFPNRTAEALRKRYLKLIDGIVKNQPGSRSKSKRSSPKRKQQKNSYDGKSRNENVKKPASPTKKRKTPQSPRTSIASNSNECRRSPSPPKKKAHASSAHSSPPRRRKNEIEPDSRTSVKKEKKGKKSGRSSRAAGDSDTSLEFTWICTACREAECVTDPNSPLLVCEGRCVRPFHYPCAGLASLPPANETWICSDCKQGKHQCAVCHEYGIDDQDVFCCDSKECGLFFHEACLSMYDVDVKIVEETISSDGSTADTEVRNTIYEEEKTTGEAKEVNKVQVDNENRLESQVEEKPQPFERVRSRPKFKCPAHKCWTCATDIPAVEAGDDTSQTNCAKGQKKSKGKRKASQSLLSICFSSKRERLVRCLECPIAYHITCIPPSCRFHELALLCHEHSSSSKLPDLDVDSSFQKDVEATADKKLELICQSNLRKAHPQSLHTKGRRAAKTVQQMNYENKFLPGMKGSVRSNRESKLIQQLDEHTVSSSHQNSLYCLPCDFQKEVQSKPPIYSHVHCLKYMPSNRPKRRPPCDEACRCVKSDDGVPVCGEDCLNRMMYVECVGNSDATRGEKNPYWNCNNGTECGNRVISQRQGAKCRPKRERGKGWGLVTLNNLKKGDYVQEYAGEVIDEDLMQQRLKSWTCDHPNDPNFYIMRLEPGWYIDAREKGNLSRFINHSCDPNCHLVPVNVAGWMRVAIVCTRDIKAGEFLSYDYQFDTKHGEKFVCRCGAKNCRGTMKGGKGQDSKDGTGSEKKTKKQLLTEAKARLERDKKFLAEVEESEKERLNQIGILVPGEIKDGSNTVASGPQLGCKDSAQKNRIFLWRTALIGADLSARHWRLTRTKNTPGSNGKPNGNGDNEKLCKVDILSVVKRSNTV